MDLTINDFNAQRALAVATTLATVKPKLLEATAPRAEARSDRSESGRNRSKRCNLSSRKEPNFHTAFTHGGGSTGLAIKSVLPLKQLDAGDRDHPPLPARRSVLGRLTQRSSRLPEPITDQLRCAIPQSSDVSPFGHPGPPELFAWLAMAGG